MDVLPISFCGQSFRKICSVADENASSIGQLLCVKLLNCYPTSKMWAISELQIPETMKNFGNAIS
jgi:hypothetical protein